MLCERSSNACRRSSSRSAMARATNTRRTTNCSVLFAPILRQRAGDTRCVRRTHRRVLTAEATRWSTGSGVHPGARFIPRLVEDAPAGVTRRALAAMDHDDARVARIAPFAKVDRGCIGEDPRVDARVDRSVLWSVDYWMRVIPASCHQGCEHQQAVHAHTVNRFDTRGPSRGLLR